MIFELIAYPVTLLNSVISSRNFCDRFPTVFCVDSHTFCKKTVLFLSLLFVFNLYFLALSEWQECSVLHQIRLLRAG